MSVSEGFQIPSRIAYLQHAQQNAILYTSHLCPHFDVGSVLTTYFVWIFLYEQSFLPVLRCGWLTTYFVQFVFFCYKQICPSYHHYMGKKLSISRCNRHFSLLQLLGARSSLIPAASTTHFAAIMSICFQQACMHMHMRLHAYAHSRPSMHACL
jgi:hypothetical protein